MSGYLRVVGVDHATGTVTVRSVPSQYTRTLERDGSTTLALAWDAPVRLPAGYHAREVAMAARAPAYARDLFSLATVRMADEMRPVVDAARQRIGRAVYAAGWPATN